MSEKRKRKAGTELNGHSSKKKQPTAPNPTLEIRSSSSPEAAQPVIAICPGASLPENLEFKAVAGTVEHGSDLLLQSSSHPSIDYTAVEGGTFTDNHLKHYVAVYDPDSNQLDIKPAKQMTVRRTVRQAALPEETDSPPERPTQFSTLSALTHAFGTQKSKKLIQSRGENALYDRNADPNAVKPLSEALLSSMPEAEAPRRKTDAAAIQAGKPLPIPNLNASNVSEAYPLSHLVFPSPYTSTLTSMPILDWHEVISEGGAISTSSRFVANRLNYVCRSVNANSTDIDAQSPNNLHLLRYILLLIELSRKISGQPRNRPLPDISKWTADDFSDIPTIPTPLLTKLIQKYCPTTTTPTKSDLDLLQTTILALTLHIPPPSGHHGRGMLMTDPTDICLDLNLPRKSATTYLKELGCQLERPTDHEWDIWGLPKPQRSEQIVRFAKLRLPLVFPTAHVARRRPR